jgi:transposase-like protein
MLIFEKNLRARMKKVEGIELEPQRRGPKKKPKNDKPKSAGFNTREARMELHNKTQQVRDLILQNKNNKQIASIVGVDTSFVARNRLRMFRQKMKLVEEGELEVDEDEIEFKYLSHEMKMSRIIKLMDEGHRAIEVARMLKIEERTVNRWRERIKEMEKDPEEYKKILEKSRFQNKPVKQYSDCLPRYRRTIEKSQIENTKTLLECGFNYREISKKVGLPMSNVMKIKKAMLTNTIDKIVDDTAEKIKENVLMRKSGLIEEEPEEVKPRRRPKKRKPKSKVRSEKIELRKKRIKIKVESESENCSEVDDENWCPQDSESSDYDGDNWAEEKLGCEIEIKEEKFDDVYVKELKVEKEDVRDDQGMKKFFKI